ncbi:MAG: hypothetical protein ABSA11_04525 [Candidatus Bathyarchaeia archaeon]
MVPLLLGTYDDLEPQQASPFFRPYKTPITVFVVFGRGWSV